MSRCLPAVAIASLALVLASPLAQAQVASPFVMSATPPSAEVYPGETATFSISIANEHPVLDRTAQMSLTRTLPVGWLYAFEPATLQVPNAGKNTSILSIFVPNGTLPQTLAVPFEANDTTFGVVSKGEVNVTVKARRAPIVDAGTPPPPRVSISVTGGESAEAGTTARGLVTLLHDDANHDVSLSVRLSAAAPSGWTAYLNAADQNRILAPGQSATLPVFVDVPALQEAATADVRVFATVGERTYSATWTLTGTPAPTVEAPAEGSDDPSPTAPTPAAARPPTSGAPGFEILVEPIDLPIEAGGDAEATLKLANTGGTTLTINLLAPAPETWRPFEIERSSVTLAPGERADVKMTLHAPEGVPAGGSADITIAGNAGGLVRSSQLTVRTILPAVPADQSRASAASTVEAPAGAEGSGLPSAGPTALLAVGLAAAGASALVLINRPLREKLLWGAAGLYTRLARPDVLGHEDRERLYRLVESQPGIHFHALQRDLGWNTGTLTYHLRVLEKHGFVVSRRDGLYRRFYLSGAAPRKETFENQGPSGLRADVLEAIRNTPGISQSDLALGLGANKQTVNYHVKALERVGTIRVEKRGRDTFLYAAEGPSADADVARA